MNRLSKTLAIIILSSCMHSAKADAYSFKINSIRGDVSGHATLDLVKQKFSVTLKLHKGNENVYSYHNVKMHLHHTAPRQNPNYKTCENLGGHLDSLLSCGPKSEYQRSKYCRRNTKKGAYEEGDLSVQFPSPLKLYDGKTHTISIGIKKIHFVVGHFVKEISLVVHANKRGNNLESVIIACSPPIPIK